MSRAWVSAAALLGALWAPVPALAYVCTQVPDDGPTLWWQPRTIPLVFHDRCSADVADVNACFGAYRASLQAWNNVDCTDFTFEEMGVTANSATGFDWRRPDEAFNTIVFREGDPDDANGAWRHQRGALAITTVTFNSQTGRILDADVEFNGVPNGGTEYEFAVCTQGGLDCLSKNDIQNTLTHELGHVLGLDHPPTPEATMYASAPPGELTKRTLFTDDANGICAIYPPGAEATPCTPPPNPLPPDPRFRQIRACDDTGLDPCDRPGCSQAGSGTWGVAGLLGGTLLGRRRRRSRHPGR